MLYLFAVCNLVLSPITFLLFYFLCANLPIFIKGDGVNLMRLKLSAYALFCVVLAAVAALLLWAYNANSPQPVSALEILQPRFWWLSFASWLITTWTLQTYRKGMEGNLMGFIFFPSLLIASMVLVGVNVAPLTTQFKLGGEALYLNSWLAFALHGGSPALLLLLVASSANKEVDAISKLLTVYVMYGLLAAAHYLLLMLLGLGFDLARFWGWGQSWGYYLPYLLGFGLHGYFAVRERLPDGGLKQGLRLLAAAVGLLALGMQAVQYVQFCLGLK